MRYILSGTGIALLSSWILLTGAGCKKDGKDNDPPECSITSPASGTTFQQGELVTIIIVASDPDGIINNVDLFIDGLKVASMDNPPYEYTWDTSPAEEGTHPIKAAAMDNRGEEGISSIGIEITEVIGELTIIDDRDGKVYEIIRIGTQWWMAENMNFDAGSGCWIYEDEPGNADIYGRLYEWDAASGACPAGWHLPDDGEWATLISYLGGDAAAGGKMKSAGTVLWSAPNAGATNESRFNALPGGYRDVAGNYSPQGENARFWTSTAFGGDAVFRQLQYDSTGVTRDVSQKGAAMSVRCVKD